MVHLKALTSWRVLAFAILAALCILPAAGSARPGPQPEPILLVPGFDSDCRISGDDASVAGYPPLVEANTDEGVRTDAAARWGVQPLAPGWELGFTTAAGYDFCRVSTTRLGRRFYDWAERAIANWNRTLPPGYEPITKVDVVGYSYGATITRSCIANAGRENPTTATPDCAALIDDWVGMAPPSHGTKTPWAIGCPFAPGTLCGATSPSGDFLLKLNERFNGAVPDRLGAGDETPTGPGPDPVEYSVYFGGEDGLIKPPASAGLWGAANFRVQVGIATPTKRAKQLTHRTIGDTGICKGSPEWGTSATREWIAWQLLDAAPHAPTPEESPRKVPTSAAPFTILNCETTPPGFLPFGADMTGVKIK